MNWMTSRCLKVGTYRMKKRVSSSISHVVGTQLGLYCLYSNGAIDKYVWDFLQSSIFNLGFIEFIKFAQELKESEKKKSTYKLHNKVLH